MCLANATRPQRRNHAIAAVSLVTSLATAQILVQEEVEEV